MCRPGLWSGVLPCAVAFQQCFVLSVASCDRCWELPLPRELLRSDNSLPHPLSTAVHYCSLHGQAGLGARRPCLVWAQRRSSRLPGLGEALVPRSSHSWTSVCLLVPRWLPGVSTRPSHLCHCGLGQASMQTGSNGRGKVQPQR